jgi:hypothetical protein
MWIVALTGGGGGTVQDLSSGNCCWYGTPGHLLRLGIRVRIELTLRAISMKAVLGQNLHTCQVLKVAVLHRKLTVDEPLQECLSSYHGG